MGAASNIAKVAAGALVAGGLVGASMRTTDESLRPPGSSDEQDFLAKCIKCGRCIEACPFKAIIPEQGTMGIGSAVGAPTFDMREQACHMCEDFPCIAACPTGALLPVASRDVARIGTAVIKRDLCIAVKGLRCEVCYRACPFMDQAITIDYRMRENDDLHSVFEPIVNPVHCTGCGICVERCVVDDPEVAIEIVRDFDTALERIDEEQAKGALDAWSGGTGADTSALGLFEERGSNN